MSTSSVGKETTEHCVRVWSNIKMVDDGTRSLFANLCPKSKEIIVHSSDIKWNARYTSQRPVPSSFDSVIIPSDVSEVDVTLGKAPNSEEWCSFKKGM